MISVIRKWGYPSKYGDEYFMAQLLGLTIPVGGVY
jgi:hypothetical protein